MRRALRTWAQAAQGITLGTAIVIAAFGTGPMLSAETHAAAGTTVSVIREHSPALAEALATEALLDHGLTPDQARSHSARATAAGIETGSCWPYADGPYRTSRRCHISVHLPAPERMSFDGVYHVEMIRPQGFIWPFSTLTVIGHQRLDGASLETYGETYGQEQ